MSILDYIQTFYNGNQSAFAASQGVHRAQITQWINKEFIVIDHVLYSPRRELIQPINFETK